MMATGSFAGDRRAVARSLAVGLLGIALLGFVVFLVFGGAILDGGNSETPAQPADNGTDTTSDGPDNPDEGTDSGENTTEEDLPETVDIDVNVWETEIGDEARYSTLALRNESGGVVERKSLTQISSTSFEDLSYGDEYSLSVEVDQWPTERIEFEAGDFDERDVVVGYDFKAADSFRFVTYEDKKDIATGGYQLKGKRSANRDAYYYLQYLNTTVWAEYVTFVDRELTLVSSNSDPEISELDGYPGVGHPWSVDYDLVFWGLGRYDDREYITTTKLENNPDRWVGNNTAGQTFDIYDVDLGSQYSDDD